MNIHVDGREVSLTCYIVTQPELCYCQLFGRMMRESQTYDKVVINAIKRIRGLCSVPIMKFG